MVIDPEVQERVLTAIATSEEEALAVIRDLSGTPSTSTTVADADSNGYTLLHHAVRMTESIAVLKLLANPTSLTAQNIWKRTALHQACGFGRPSSVIRFLVQQCTRALDQPDEWGLVPLHYACWKGMDADLIEFMMEASPNSIRTVSLEGETPLYSACECERSQTVPFGIYQRLATEWPVACGIVYAEAEVGRQCLAFRRAHNHGQPMDVVTLLETTARDVLATLVECACNESSRMPSATRAELQRLAADAAPGQITSYSLVESQSLASGSAVTKCSQSFCIPTNDVEAVLHQPEVQSLLLDPSYQSHLCGLIRTKAAGLTVVTSKIHAIQAIEIVQDNVGCMYVMLREWPFLFCS